MLAMKEEIRKGPWTEREDLQLVCYVGLFGERRWDFIAKVSGLNRTGKSCRLRWINYLHPGLKRGRMSPQEERIVLELHARWGNRWSRIAQRLPGRTDNEIKNYWRTHMRKKAQERKRNSSPSLPPPSLNTIFPPVLNEPLMGEGSENCVQLNSTGSDEGTLTSGCDQDSDDNCVKVYPMEQIWQEIDKRNDETCSTSCPPMLSPIWDYGCDSLWKMDDEEFKMFPPLSELLLVPDYQYGM